MLFSNWKEEERLQQIDGHTPSGQGLRNLLWKQHSGWVLPGDTGLVHRRWPAYSRPQQAKGGEAGTTTLHPPGAPDSPLDPTEPTSVLSVLCVSPALMGFMHLWGAELSSGHRDVVSAKPDIRAV